VPITPGANVDDLTSFAELESMPTRSIISNPASGTSFATGTRQVALRGAAWAGDHSVTRVDVSINYGQSWSAMNLSPPRNRFDWVRWTGNVTLPGDGYFDIWVRATDSRGLMQPHAAGHWNPQGYGANPFHRISIQVG
jgi:hypothetical protein